MFFKKLYKLYNKYFFFFHKNFLLFILFYFIIFPLNIVKVFSIPKAYAFEIFKPNFD